MIHFTTSYTDQEFYEIIELQKTNLPQNLTDEEIKSQGFLTVSHSLEDLQKMHTHAPNIVMKDGDKIIGYLLAMTKKSRLDIPVLIPMFESFDRIQYQGKCISDYNYLVVGQVCIHKNYRGQGLLDGCYEAYKDFFKENYDFAITEIAKNNHRSTKAHNRIGFVEIHTITDVTEWSVVVWDWRNGDDPFFNSQA